MTNKPSNCHPKFLDPRTSTTLEQCRFERKQFDLESVPSYFSAYPSFVRSFPIKGGTYVLAYGSDDSFIGSVEIQGDDAYFPLECKFVKWLKKNIKKTNGAYDVKRTGFGSSDQPESWYFGPNHQNEEKDWWIFLQFITIADELFMDDSSYDDIVKKRLFEMELLLSKPLAEGYGGLEIDLGEYGCPSKPSAGISFWLDRVLERIDPKGAITGVDDSIRKIVTDIESKWLLDQKQLLQQIVAICRDALVPNSKPSKSNT